jgi:hypothetical protein
MLNQHSEIGIAREIELYKLPSIAPLLSETAVHHGDSWTQLRRDEVVKAIWFFVGRPVQESKLAARRWGTKTPWSEFDIELWDPLVSPAWVYVLRRGDRVFQSHIRLAYGEAEHPEHLTAKYKESVRLGEKMQAAGTGHICQLDLATDPDSRWRLARDLFGFLEEDIDSGVTRFLEEWPTEHPATHPTSDNGPAGQVELPDAWQELLDSDSEYQEMMQAHGY